MNLSEKFVDLLFSSSVKTVVWASVVGLIVFLLICLHFNLTSGKPVSEQIKILAEGRLVSIRSTGAWSIYDTELKFDDGSMLLTTYSFAREHDLKENHSYVIWWSSIYDRCCKELIEEK